MASKVYHIKRCGRGKSWCGINTDNAISASDYVETDMDCNDADRKHYRYCAFCTQRLICNMRKMAAKIEKQ